MRGKVVDVGGGQRKRYRYDYYDVYEKDSSSQALQAKGYQGGGESWAGIVYGLLELRSPATLAAIDFDPEAEGLAVWSDDRAALETIGRLVAEAKASPDLLDAAVDAATKAGRME